MKHKGTLLIVARVNGSNISYKGMVYRSKRIKTRIDCNAIKPVMLTKNLNVIPYQKLKAIKIWRSGYKGEALGLQYRKKAVDSSKIRRNW